MNRKLPTPPPARSNKGEKLDDKYIKESNVMDIIVGIMIVVLLLLLLSNHAKASDLCQNWATQAEGVMIARQDGMTLDEITQRLKDTKDIPEKSKPMMEAIIKDAYSADIQQSLASKIQIIEDFADYVLIACIQQTKDKV